VVAADGCNQPISTPPTLTKKMNLTRLSVLFAAVLLSACASTDQVSGAAVTPFNDLMS
jgi:hypothetical protein